ncbi:MAG TPA: HNH endonuclease, partial [Myxococcales bacterium]|nr:HNH endonuclease [Myxococcales bacterium]
REAFKLVLERDRKRKALTERPRPVIDRPRPVSERPRPVTDPLRLQTDTPCENDRYVPAAVKRAVWKRDQGRCTWPMGDGAMCGETHRLEFDHDLEVALGGKPTIGNVRLLCKTHNLMKAEQRFGKTFMAKFRKDFQAERDTS